MKPIQQGANESATELTSEHWESEQQRKPFPTKAVVLGICIAFAVAATIAIKEMPTAEKKMMEDSLIDFAATANKTNKTKKVKLLPKPEECSMAKTQNCMTSKCCDNFGFQCYQKKRNICFVLEEM